MGEVRYSVSFWWRPREGGRQELTFEIPDSTEASLSSARELAMRCGYPGHNGGWWNYLVDDVHNWLVRRGWTNCQCHPAHKGEGR